MRALAAGLGVLAPMVSIAGVVFGVMWKLKHPHRPVRAQSTLGRVVKTVLLVTAVALVLLASVLFAFAMIRATLELN